MIYAVIDTNVLVSSLLTHHLDAATAQVVEAVMKKLIRPLYSEEILAEYAEVLHRPKFHFTPEVVDRYIRFIQEEGLRAERVLSDDFFPDATGVVFYEVALSKDDAYLVTGNIRHFPKNPIVVTPVEMLEILYRTTKHTL